MVFRSDPSGFMVQIVIRFEQNYFLFSGISLLIGAYLSYAGFHLEEVLSQKKSGKQQRTAIQDLGNPSK